MTISKENLQFLSELKNNNNKDWFNENKPTYQKYHLEMVEFSNNVIALMNLHDNIETPNGKKALMRIYRDVRFSKDKTPYKTNWGGYLKRATKGLRGGYYFHIEPGNSFVGGGFWGPNKDDLLRIRQEFDLDGEEFKEIINEPNFFQTFGNMNGEQLKTAPKGFPKDHKHIDLLKYKQFLFSKKFTDKEVLSDDFAKKVSETFKAIRPFFDYMSSVLTTNANGESIL